MTKYEIYIYIDQVKVYSIKGTNSLKINVISEKNYDPLSKKIKKYRHEIQYKESYNKDDYYLYIVDPRIWYKNYFFKYYRPTKQIKSVDIYFPSDDTENKKPLVFGFNQAESDSIYYTYYHLIDITYKFFFTVSQSYTLPTEGSFLEDDLITRLLDELGLYVKGRENKFVFRLDKKTNGSEIKYPKTGFNKQKITLKKSTDSKHSGYVKYTHSIISSSNVEAFYISFNRNSLYFQRASISNSIFLENISVYYSVSEDKIPLLFVFKSRVPNETYHYKYSEFQADLIKPNNVKKITELTKSNSNEFTILQEESKKLKKEITFKNEGENNRHVLQQIHDIGNYYTKFTFRANTVINTADWEVYNNQLFAMGNNGKIDQSILKGVIDQTFTSISVYYDKKNNALLVEFVKSSGNIYFKKKKGENSWEQVLDGNDYKSNLATKLSEIEKDLIDVKGQKSTTGESDHEEPVVDQLKDPPKLNDNITTYIISGSVIGGLVLIGSIGGGGYYWYRRSISNRGFL